MSSFQLLCEKEPKKGRNSGRGTRDPSGRLFVTRKFRTRVLTDTPMGWILYERILKYDEYPSVPNYENSDYTNVCRSLLLS